MLRMAKSVLLAVAALSVVGCANKALEREVDVEAQGQPPRALHGEVAVKGLDALESSDLPEEQKAKLRGVHARIYSEIFHNQDETAKLKGVLFETLTASPYQADKVAVIKNKLIALNSRKMKVMMDALEEVEQIVGYAPERRELYRPFLMDGPMLR